VSGDRAIGYRDFGRLRLANILGLCAEPICYPDRAELGLTSSRPENSSPRARGLWWRGGDAGRAFWVLLLFREWECRNRADESSHTVLQCEHRLRRAYTIVGVTASLFDTGHTVVRKKVASTDQLLRGGLGADSSDFVKYFRTAFSMVRL